MESCLKNEKKTEKPQVIRVQPDNIPEEIREMRAWLNWQYKPAIVKNGMIPKKPWTKVPFSPVDGGSASTTNPHTWGSFSAAVARWVQWPDIYSGIGFIIRDGIIGIDLDSCRDPATGRIAEWAKEIIRKVRSYTEISPSGTGIRIICRGILPPGRNRSSEIGLEIYDEFSPRFLTMTGAVRCLPPSLPSTIEQRPSEVLWIAEKYLPPAVNRRVGKVKISREEKSVSVELDRILCVARAAKNGDKFCKLWAGKWADNYPSQSEADLALASLLAFYIGPDPEAIDDAFRASGLYRDKWERDDYRDHVIDLAVDIDEFYKWGDRLRIFEEMADLVLKGYSIDDLKGGN